MKRLIFLVMVVLMPHLAGAAEEKVLKAVVDVDGVQRVEVVGESYFFDPDHIIVKAGVPVELKVRRDSLLVPHNILIHELQAGIDIAESLGRESIIIRFTFTKPGRYPFYCDKRLLFFKNHRERGMEGVIEVVE